MPPLLLGIALGAAGAFLFDPHQGARRRAMARDKMLHGVRESRSFATAAGKDLRHRAEGLAAEAKLIARRESATPEQLVARVRSRLGRYVAHPHAVHVTASHEGIVSLGGDILAAEHPRLLAMARMVRGVHGVEDRLIIHQEAGKVPALQGVGPASGGAVELMQVRWTPGIRLISGSTGMALVFSAIARGGITGILALGAGALLLARTGINQRLPDAIREATRRSKPLPKLEAPLEV